MKYFYLLIFCSYLLMGYAQDETSVEPSQIQLKFIHKRALTAEKFVGVDDLGNSYYINNNTLFKKTKNNVFTYTNILLGEISSAAVQNPLKVIVFYKNFNTALVLDNRLNELTKPFNFSAASFSKNIALVGLSSNDNMWLYSADDSTLILWHHPSKKIVFTSQPISNYFSVDANFIAHDLISTYKYCWLVDKQQGILKFDEYGIFNGALNKSGIDFIKPANIGLVLLRNNKLTLYNNDLNNGIDLAVEQHVNIQSFYLNKKHLYLFDGNTIFVYEYLKK